MTPRIENGAFRFHLFRSTGGNVADYQIDTWAAENVLPSANVVGDLRRHRAINS